MTEKAPDLCSVEEAEGIIEEGELDEALEAGTLRKVWHRPGNNPEAPLESYLLGEDVRRLARMNDPRHLARLVGRGGGDAAVDDDDPESPRNLAAGVPRL